MAEMAVAFGAANFHPAHSVAGVDMFNHCIGGDRSRKARPTRTRIIFAVAAEQRIATASTIILASGFIMVECARKRTFGASLSQNMILFGGEALPPFGFSQSQLFHDI